VAQGEIEKNKNVCFSEKELQFQKVQYMAPKNGYLQTLCLSCFITLNAKLERKMPKGKNSSFLFQNF
jgi:hypothetical protein